MADRGIVSSIRAHLDGRIFIAQRKREFERALRRAGFSIAEAKKAVAERFRDEATEK